MSVFPDDDLKRFATICDDKCHCRGEAHDSDCPWLLFKAMKARLEASEAYLKWGEEYHGHYGKFGSDGYKAGCVQCFHLDAWRKSKGEV